MCTQPLIRSVLLSVLAGLPWLCSSVGTLWAVDLSPLPLCRQPPVVDFTPNHFSNPTQIDNRWLPMVPGTRLILEGTANDEGEVLSRRIEFTITDLTKVINGVRTVVVLDKDFNDGQLVERELAFFAQDDAGNVWNLGEYPEEFEDGELLGAPETWIAGLAQAQPGIHMPANPQVGGPRYLQGWAPDIDFLDCAKVLQRGQQTCVPFRCYDNVLITDEVSPLEPDSGHQRKYHAPGVGIVHVGAVGDPEAETLGLVQIVHLGPTELAQLRATVRKMDQRGYRLSPDLYAHTPPVE
jgi:hypothetical protein